MMRVVAKIAIASPLPRTAKHTGMGRDWTSSEQAERKSDCKSHNRDTSLSDAHLAENRRGLVNLASPNPSFITPNRTFMREI